MQSVDNDKNQNPENCEMIMMKTDKFTWIRGTALQSEALQPFQNRATEHSFTSGR